MLSAFMHWYSSVTLDDRIRVHELYTIDHHTFPMSGVSVVQPRMADGHVIPSRPCSESNCRRCSTGSGGYKFLWYDMRWVDSYNQLRREGSAALPLPWVRERLSP